MTVWIYQQHDGQLVHNNSHIGWGYSGAGIGKNNPDAQEVADVGPIPRGLWLIEGPPMDTKTHGPYVLTLTPTIRTHTYGRGGFLIHGDSIISPGTASEGCVVLSRLLRSNVWDSGDREFLVVA